MEAEHSHLRGQYVFADMAAEHSLRSLISAELRVLCVQVYEHHCVQQLPGPTRRLRDGALYMANNIDAVQWALELYGFKDVVIKVSHLHFCSWSAHHHSLGECIRGSHILSAHTAYAARLQISRTSNWCSVKVEHVLAKHACFRFEDQITREPEQIVDVMCRWQPTSRPGGLQRWRQTMRSWKSYSRRPLLCCATSASASTYLCDNR